MAALGDENICGFYVAVDDAFAWAASSASAISMASSSTVSISIGTAADGVLERHAVEKLHGDEGRVPSCFVDFVNRADVGMVEGGSGLGFALEALSACASLATSSGRNLRATKRCSLGPRLCRRRPCRRRQVFRQCGSARRCGRSERGDQASRHILGCARCKSTRCGRAAECDFQNCVCGVRELRRTLLCVRGGRLRRQGTSVPSGFRFLRLFAACATFRRDTPRVISR